MKPGLRTPWILLTLILIMGAAGQWALSRRMLSRANSGLVEAAFRGLCRALDDAYRQHDDIVLQNIMAALAQTPGVEFACVTNRRHQILAHTDPSRIGRPFESTLTRLWTRALPEGGTGQTWGRLLISVSDPFAHQSSRWQVVVLLVLTLSIPGCVFLFLRRWAVVFRQSQNQVEELRFRCRELTSLEERERGRLENTNLRWTFWMQEILDRVPVPALLLDEAQRVVAWSPSLRERLDGGTDRALTGISWQDLAVLAECGDALQDSLDHPGETIETHRENCRIVFTSNASPLGASTWITFPSSSHS